MQALVTDLLRYFEESVPSTTSWIVAPTHALLSLPALQATTTSSVRQELTPLAALPIQEISPLHTASHEHLLPKEELIPSPLLQEDRFAPLFALMEQHFPSHPLRTKPVDDRILFWQLVSAKILVISTIEEKIPFLHNLTRAIQGHFGQAMLFRPLQDLSSDDLALLFLQTKAELIIALPDILTVPILSSHIRHDSSIGDYFLHNKKLLLLEPLTIYMEKPSHKKALWSTLVHHLTQALL